jgi:HNH endonuclease
MGLAVTHLEVRRMNLNKQETNPLSDYRTVRFWKKVQIGQPHECWPWLGTKLMSQGGRPAYGYVWFNQKSRTAHSVAWEVANGRKVPDRLHVCHHCDNPPCCNPSHLFAGTGKDNMQDMVAKGRHYIPTESPKTRGRKHWKCKLTDEQVREIRSRSNEPRKRLAMEFQTSARYISSIICRQKWSWLI